MRLRILCVVGAAAAASGLAARADILETYNSSGVSASAATWSAFSVDPNLTANTLSRGAGLVNNDTGSNRFGASDFDTSATLNTVLNDYFTFGFNVPAGNSATITDVRFVLARTGSTNVGPQNAQLYYTTDGGTTLNVVGSAITVGTGLGVTMLTGLSIPVASGQTFEFRIYGYNAGSAGGFMRLLDDNVTTDPKAIQILGTTTPAPAATAMFGLAGAIIFRRRRGT